MLVSEFQNAPGFLVSILENFLSGDLRKFAYAY